MNGIGENLRREDKIDNSNRNYSRKMWNSLMVYDLSCLLFLATISHLLAL